MNDENIIFELVISKFPEGIKANDISITKNRAKLFVPGWLFNNTSDDFVWVNINNVYIDNTFIPAQILYDIFVLKISRVEDRPKCPVCNKSRKFKNFSSGYIKTCGDDVCRKGMLFIIWKDAEYRNKQTESHKLWADDPKNKEFLRTRTLNTWTDKNYRDKQVESHKLWAEKKENKARMRETTKNLWKNPNYRAKQVESHKLFVKNNPDKIFKGNPGTINSEKSNNKSIKYDSTWEKDVIVQSNIIDKILSINRSDLSIPYYYKESLYYYVPDFIIETVEGKFLVEVKCKFLLNYDPKTEYKIKAGIDYVNNDLSFKKYIILMDEDLYLDSSQKLFNLDRFLELLEIKD